MRPRSVSRGSCAMAAASAGTLAGAAPPLDVSPPTFTWMQTLSGASVMGPLRRKALGDAQPIHAVHPGEVLGERARLVGLDLADEVPGELEPRECLHFRQRFLQVVLAEVSHPQAAAAPQGLRPAAPSDAPGV